MFAKAGFAFDFPVVQGPVGKRGTSDAKGVDSRLKTEIWTVESVGRDGQPDNPVEERDH